MTRYTVVWNQKAQDELAEIWLIARDRNAVTAAVNEIDILLGIDPAQRGDGVGNQRHLYIPPLQVLFEVIEPDRMVRVLYVIADSFPKFSKN